MMTWQHSVLKRLKRGMRSGPLIGSFALIMVAVMIAGCALIKLKKEVKALREDTVIVGKIHGKFPGDGPIIIAACSMENGIQVERYSVAHDAGEYEIPVYPGAYYLFAYWDKNSNMIYDPGEPAGHYGAPTLVQAPAVGVVFDKDIAIPESGRKIKVAHGTTIVSPRPQNLYSRQSGIITDLDDARFAKENGRLGFWEPGSFFYQFGGAIYFLEKYDPEKIPILFIHGATGTPQDWQYMVKHIDRTRFQPWFFYYPTGLRIESMAYLLLWKLSNLQAKYQFNKIYLTAHSMGGLVARSFIVNFGPEFPYVDLFISLATPWGGDPMAELGVKQSPVVIPSWIDMQPDGDFVKSLYRKKLPDSVSFYLFYGFRGNRNPFRSNNDGTITLSSLLDARPQAEAEKSYAFDEDHASILASEKVVSQYNAILKAFDEKDRTELQQPGGYLKVHFSYAYETEGLKPRKVLVLQRKGDKEEEIVTYLDDADNGKILGPFPGGEYAAGLATMAAKTEEEFTAVAVEPNKIKELNFVFQPEGVIRGYLTTTLKPDDKFTGRPDHRYRTSDTKINIQSILLKGNGIHRSLEPIKGPEIDRLAPAAIRRMDYCYNNYFGFYGLPAGVYTVFIKAEGYQPIEKAYTVIPGVPDYYRPTELTPE